MFECALKQHTCDRAVRLSLLSVTLLYLMPPALLHTPMASWLHRTAQTFVNCHLPIINLPYLVILGIYTVTLIHLWFTPLLHRKSANDVLVSRQHSLALSALPDITWQRGSQAHCLQLPRRWICKDIECTHFFAETCLPCDPHELRSKLVYVPLSHLVPMAMALLLEKGSAIAESGCVKQAALCGVLLSD